MIRERSSVLRYTYTACLAIKIHVLANAHVLFNYPSNTASKATFYKLHYYKILSLYVLLHPNTLFDMYSQKHLFCSFPVQRWQFNTTESAPQWDICRILNWDANPVPSQQQFSATFTLRPPPPPTQPLNGVDKLNGSLRVRVASIAPAPFRQNCCEWVAGNATRKN
jgi:hypothetical protein